MSRPHVHCLCFLALAGVGCNPMGSAYTVAIDPAFTPDQIDAIREGLDDWNASVTSAGGELHLTSYVGDCPPLLDMTQHVLCVHASSDAYIYSQGLRHGSLGNTRRADFLDSAQSWIAVDNLANYTGDIGFAQPGYFIRLVVEHELGHGMGLQHTEPSDLMYIDMTGKYAGLQPNDVNQYEYLRGQVSEKTFTLDGPAVLPRD
jgi:hypothetical protein